MKLYDLVGAEDDLRFSPNCWRIKIALEHKGLVAETVPWRFVEKDVIAFSRQKAVPVLVDGDKSVSDSWEIARYLDNAYSEKPSLFAGSAGEGLALFVKFWCEQTLNRIILRIILPDLFRCLHEKDKAYFRESREARFGTTLEQYALPSQEGVLLLRDAISPMRATLQRQPLCWRPAIRFSSGVSGCLTPLEVLLATRVTTGPEILRVAAAFDVILLDKLRLTGLRRKSV